MDLEAAQQAPADWDFWKQGLHRSFTSKLYWRGTQIGAALALLFLGFDQKQIAFGLACGTAIALFSVWTVEATVRLLFNGGEYAGLKLALGAVIKMPFMLAALIPIAQACSSGVMNAFALVGGVLLCHGVMLVQVIAAAMAAQGAGGERKR